MISPRDLKTLRSEDPKGFLEQVREHTSKYVLGLEDHRFDRGLGWGGELRLIINANVELHFVAGFNAEMETAAELPQFCVFPDDAQAGKTRKTLLEVPDLAEPVRGTIFFVSTDEYRCLCQDVAEILERYGDFELVPDGWLATGALKQLLEKRVLEDSEVTRERRFDFRRGVVAVLAAAPLAPTESPESDEADAFLARHSDVSSPVLTDDDPGAS